MLFDVEKFCNESEHPIMQDAYDELFSGEDIFGEWCQYYLNEHPEGNPLKKALENVGLQAEIQEHHGGEGEGDGYWCVYSLSDGKTTEYYRLEGWYASYSGSEYERTVRVYPKQVQVTKWTTYPQEGDPE